MTSESTVQQDASKIAADVKSAGAAVAADASKAKAVLAYVKANYLQLLGAGVAGKFSGVGVSAVIALVKHFH